VTATLSLQLPAGRRVGHRRRRVPAHPRREPSRCQAEKSRPRLKPAPTPVSPTRGLKNHCHAWVSRRGRLRPHRDAEVYVNGNPINLDDPTGHIEQGVGSQAAPSMYGAIRSDGPGCPVGQADRAQVDQTAAESANAANASQVLAARVAAGQPAFQPQDSPDLTAWLGPVPLPANYRNLGKINSLYQSEWGWAANNMSGESAPDLTFLSNLCQQNRSLCGTDLTNIVTAEAGSIGKTELQIVIANPNLSHSAAFNIAGNLAGAQTGLMAGASFLSSEDSRDIVNIYKAPQPGQAGRILKSGFNAEDYPGTPGEVPNGMAYFAKEAELAQEFGESYQDGVIQVSIPSATYNETYAQYEARYQGGPLTELEIPASVVESLNVYPRTMYEEETPAEMPPNE
jgi:hypothetical protein